MSDPSSGRRFRGSLGISSLLHLGLFALIVPVVASSDVQLGQSGGAPKTLESVTMATLTIEHHRAPRRRPAPATSQRPIRTVAAAPAPARPQRERTAPQPPERSSRIQTTSRPSLARASRTHRIPVAVLFSTAAPERAAVRTVAPRASVPPATPEPVVSASAAPSASPSPAPDERAVAQTGIDVPAGGWGQSFEKPLVADDAALSALRAKYHVATAIVVAVDQDGRATSVSLPDGLSDDVRSDIERRLRELRYVPAECNGLRCDGTLQITL